MSFQAWVFLPREGRKVYKTFPALKAANAWRASTIHALGRGQLKAPVRRTLREECEDWLARAQRGEISTRSERPYKPSVLRTFSAHLHRYVLPDLGGRRVSEITRRDVQALVDRLRGDGHSGSTVRNIVVALKVVFRRALENDELAVNPTEGLRLPPPAGTRDQVVSATEAERLLRVLPADLRALYATAAYAGLRRGEPRGLKWSDVDLASGVIEVRRSCDEKEGAIEPKSSKGVRQVPIAPVLRDLLDEHKAATGRGGEDFVFGFRADHPFTPTVVRRRALRTWEPWNAEEARRLSRKSESPSRCTRSACTNSGTRSSR